MENKREAKLIAIGSIRYKLIPVLVGCKSCKHSFSIFVHCSPRTPFGEVSKQVNAILPKTKCPQCSSSQIVRAFIFND